MKHVLMLFIGLSACNSDPVKTEVPPPLPQVFQYATLPDQPEWDVKLETPLQVEAQEIQYTPLPDAVIKHFPVPDFSGGQLMPMMTPGVFSGYGMDSSGCNTLELLASNQRYGVQWGISGGQFAHYQLLEAEEWDHQFDPREYGYLINYRGQYLEITFPDLTTMHVQKLKSPDPAKVRVCESAESWR